MAQNRDAILKLLKAELKFVESGGYKHVPSLWRSRYVFEESPSCPNNSDKARPHECSQCWLMEFVAPNLCGQQVPCRFVQLTSDGQTVDSLYRHATAEEADLALRNWLHEQIQELERTLVEVQHLPSSD